MKHIKFDHTKGMPEEQAQRAYDAGYHVEAIQILHTWVENQARGLLIAMATVTFNAETSDAWSTADTYTLDHTLKILYLFNQISKAEYSEYKELNSLRNKVVHQIFVDPYDEVYEGVPKEVYDKVFNRTIKEAYFFTQKNDEYYDQKT